MGWVHGAGAVTRPRHPEAARGGFRACHLALAEGVAVRTQEALARSGVRLAAGARGPRYVCASFVQKARVARST